MSREPIVLRRADFEGDLERLVTQVYLTAAVFRQAADLATEHAARGDEKAARAALDRAVGMLKFEDGEATKDDAGDSALAQSREVYLMGFRDYENGGAYEPPGGIMSGEYAAGWNDARIAAGFGNPKGGAAPEESA